MIYKIKLFAFYVHWGIISGSLSGLVPDVGAEGTPVLKGQYVALGSGLTEIFFALGVEDQLIGRTRYADFPPEAQAIREVGGLADPNIELLLTLKPALVLINNLSADAGVLPRLQRVGLRARVLPMLTIEDLFTATLEIGSLTGSSEAAGDLVRGWRSVLGDDFGSGDMAGGRQPLRGLILYGLDGLFSAGAHSWPDVLFALAGAENVAAAAPSAWPQLSREFILSRPPDFVIVAASTPTQFTRNQRAIARIEAGVDSFWSAVLQRHAVRFIAAEPGLFVVHGPRTIDALTLLRGVVESGR